MISANVVPITASKINEYFIVCVFQSHNFHKETIVKQSRNLIKSRKQEYFQKRVEQIRQETTNKETQNEPGLGGQKVTSSDLGKVNMPQV